MRKSQLKRLKKDAENAYAELIAARKRPSSIRRHYADLPGLIAYQEDRVAELTELEEEARGKLTKPLMDYAHRERAGTIEFYHEGAQTTWFLEKRLKRAREHLERMRTERAKGIDGKLEDAEVRIEDAERAFKETARRLAQYAVYYARQRSDIDLVWTSEEEGQWTLDGDVAGLFNGEGRKLTMKKLVLVLLEPHTHRDGPDSGDKVRTVKADLAHETSGSYSMMSAALYKAMKGLPTNAYVEIEGCVLQVRTLRKYLRLIGGPIDIQIVDGSAIKTEARPEGMLRHRATFKSKTHDVEAQIKIVA